MELVLVLIALLAIPAAVSDRPVVTSEGLYVLSASATRATGLGLKSSSVTGYMPAPATRAD